MNQQQHHIEFSIRVSDYYYVQFSLNCIGITTMLVDIFHLCVIDCELNDLHNLHTRVIHFEGCSTDKLIF